MILANPDKTDIQRQAHADMALKRKWEARVGKDVRREFRRMGDDYEAVYAHTGQPITMQTYEADITAVLRDTYRTVAGAFKYNMRENLSPALNSRLKGPVVAAEIDNTLAKFFEARAKRQARYILDTTAQRMGAALVDAHADALVGGTVDQHTVAANMGRWFRDTAPGRATSIAITEVTNCAETAKAVEAAVLKKALGKKGHLAVLQGKGLKARVVFGPDAGTHNKVWVADLDEKTRAWHADADFQSVEWGEPFQVGGEQLQYPGDESMGASLENIINCRCTVVYYANGAVWMGEEPDL